MIVGWNSRSDIGVGAETRRVPFKDARAQRIDGLRNIDTVAGAF